VVKDVAAGEVLTSDNVRSIRPGMGLGPKYWPQVIGRRARRELLRGTPVDWDAID
jgi:pseudaminic acid synthase